MTGLTITTAANERKGIAATTFAVEMGPYEVKRQRTRDANGARMYVTVEVLRKGTDRESALVRRIGGMPFAVSPTVLEDF